MSQSTDFPVEFALVLKDLLPWFEATQTPYVTINEKDDHRNLHFRAHFRALLRFRGAGAIQSARPLSELRENRQQTGQTTARQARLEDQDGINAQQPVESCTDAT